MNIEKNYNNKELTINVENRIDTITAPEFENEINDEMGKFDSLIIDFSKLDYISSAGLRVLIATQKKLKSENIPMTIKNVNGNINEIFRMSGFDKILKIEWTHFCIGHTKFNWKIESQNTHNNRKHNINQDIWY